MNFKQIKINGYTPYHVVIDGKPTFLFKADQQTRLRRVIKLHAKFKDQNIAFYTEDPKFQERVFSLDVTRAYEFENDEERTPLFFFNGNQFFKTKTVRHEPGNFLKVILTNKPVILCSQ